MPETSWTIMLTAWIVMFVAWVIMLLTALNFKRQRNHWQRIAEYKAELYNPKTALAQKE
jgi:hypothetical protein